jgi:hypothetical protein
MEPFEDELHEAAAVVAHILGKQPLQDFRNRVRLFVNAY